MVEVDGRLVRACATEVSEGMRISTKSAKAAAAQVEAFDRVLSNHMLYCTVCDNNNGNCTVHNTTKLLAIEHQRIPFRPKPYQVDNTNPFYRYDRSLHPLRPLRRGLSERRGQRNAFDQLGRPGSSRALGSRINHWRVGCREHRAWKRKAPSPAPRDVFSDCMKCWNRLRVVSRIGRLSRRGGQPAGRGMACSTSFRGDG
jgi:hypothetical protein